MGYDPIKTMKQNLALQALPLTLGAGGIVNAYQAAAKRLGFGEFNNPFDTPVDTAFSAFGLGRLGSNAGDRVVGRGSQGQTSVKLTEKGALPDIPSYATKNPVGTMGIQRYKNTQEAFNNLQKTTQIAPPAPQMQLSKFSNGMDATPENGRKQMELGTQGGQAVSEARADMQKQQQNAPAPQAQPNMAFDPRSQLGMQMAGNQPMSDEYHAQRAGALQRFSDNAALVAQNMKMDPRTASEAAFASDPKANPIFARNAQQHMNMWNSARQSEKTALDQEAQKLGLYNTEYNTVNGAELKNREIAGKNYENLTQGANYDAEAANRRAALPFIGDKYRADIAGTNAQAGLYTAQGALAGVQADAGKQTIGVQKSALEGNENALAMLGQEKNKALYASLPKVVEGVTDPTEINNRTNAYISAALEAQRAARQGKVYRQISPALPASGFGPWKQEARNATYSY